MAAARAAFLVTRDAEDKHRRLLLPVKNNLAPLGKGFAFRLEQRLVGDADKGILASSLFWESGHVDVPVEQALQATDEAAAGKKGSSAQSEAEEFLRALLAQGPVLVKDVEAEGEEARISWRTIIRAKAKLGISSQKAGMGGGWIWALPEEATVTAPKDASGAEECHV